MKPEPSAALELLSFATSRPWALDPAAPREFGGDLQGSEGEWGERVGETLEAEDAALIVRAVNEYEALLGLAQYAKHLHGCARTSTAGGLHAPGECDCGLDDWLKKLAVAS